MNTNAAAKFVATSIAVRIANSSRGRMFTGSPQSVVVIRPPPPKWRP